MDTMEVTDNKEQQQQQQQQQPVDIDFGLVDYESPAPISSVVEDDLIDYEVSENEGEEDVAIEVKSTTEEKEENVSVVVEEEDDSSPKDDDDADVHDDVSVVVEEEDNGSPDVGDKDVYDDKSQTIFPMVEEVEATLSSDVVNHTEPHISHHIPETWVYNGSSWMIYLGPNQNSFSAEYQTMLFEMPVTRLIDFLRSDISLRDDMEMSLEFPSLELTIDQRDEESSSVSLAQIYSGHAAAASLGKLSLDFINSSSSLFYHSHSTTTDEFTSFCPEPETFAFIIHTRQSVKSTLDQIMKVVEENANNTAANSVVEQQQQQQQQPVSEDVEGDKKKKKKKEEDVSTSTAALLDNDHEDDEDDEDYVAEKEEEGDHVLDETAIAEGEEEGPEVEEVEEIEEEEEGEDDMVASEEGGEDEDVVEVGDVQTNGEGDETRVESSANASPNGKNKRTKDEAITATEQEEEEEEPVAKKIKESSTKEVEEPALSTNAS